jgi:LDH2 family malate/lactate/ureidoglycolate dehydrogenase
MALYDFKDKVILPARQVIKWQQAIYVGAGMDEKDALAVADNLVTADLRGVYSHGIMRTPTYIGSFAAGGLDPKAKPEVIKKKGAIALVDGRNAIGMVSAAYATEVAIEMAREYGSATVSVTGSNHLGSCSYYAEMASKADMIGFCWSINGANIMAPWGGIDARLGNNPFAISAPCETKPPVTMDMATSVVAKGKIQMAVKTNSPIPDTWAIDADGKPTTDAKAACAGTVLPVGNYKGYGLAFMNAAITAILNNSRFGPDMPIGSPDPKIRLNVAHLIQVIDISAITDIGAFKKRMDAAVDYIKTGRKAEGIKEILVPGEPEAHTRVCQEKDGITYAGEVIRENQNLAAKYNVADMDAFR